MHTYASLLIVGAMLAQNLTRKHDQPIVYASRILNNVENNYSTIEHEALAMVFALYNSTFWVTSLCFILIIWFWSI